MTDTGQFLKRLRKVNKLSQAELAKKIGVHTQFISNIERGLCLIPHKKFKKISKLLNTPLIDLINLTLLDYEKDLKKKVYG